MNWLLVYEVIYGLILILVCLRIIYDTRSITKTLSYLLLAVFVPFAGMLFYFAFGINYRKRKMYNKKLVRNDALAKRLKEDIYHYSRQTYHEGKDVVQDSKLIARMLLKDILTPLTGNNAVKLLVNGEKKFPEVLRAIAEAKDHIHLEYYIYEDGIIGRTLAEALIQKAREGVTVRFIYDDFGSHSIGRKLVSKMRANGIKAVPFLKVIFFSLANRLNYRNHRKIIVIDGRVGFVGGINVSDKYINQPSVERRFWRDTHLRIDGPGAQYLQYLFMGDWNFCAKDNLTPDKAFFPPVDALPVRGNKIVQIVASGPDSEKPSILFSVLQAINLGREEILITTPYFIPGESLLDALIIASLSGLSVKILVPGRSDSFLVNAAAHSYYNELLESGVEIYRYTRGFIHAKTMVVDRKIAMVGTANIDFRSFDLNFEVNAIVYDNETAGELRDIFYRDIENAEKIDAVAWKNRPKLRKLFEKTVRLVSALL